LLVWVGWSYFDSDLEVRSGLGIDYYRARYYNPQTGRFISEDPAGYFGGGTNFYAYAGNDPIYFRDPYGLSFWSCFGNGFENGVLTTAAVVVVTTAVVAAAPELAAVATGVTLVGGAAGLVSTGYSMLTNPSANNLGYNLGSLTGSSIVGGLSARGVASQLSPTGYQPNPELGPVQSTMQNAWRDSIGNINPLAFLNDWLNPNSSGMQPMATGPDTYGAGAALAGEGSGLAGLAGRGCGCN
jgi:RHS repeat-associated protein